jgi:hypothetical protein
VHSFYLGISVALPEDFTLQITLANRSSTTVDIEVPSEGVTAKWEVIVQDFGVGMKATLYPDDGSTAMEVIPSMKIKAEGGLKEGLVLLPKRGKLQVTFDNTYSIFRSKTFDYRLSGANTSSASFPPASDPRMQQAPHSFPAKKCPRVKCVFDSCSADQQRVTGFLSMLLSVIEDDVKKPVSNATVDQVAEQVRTVVHM